LIEVVVGKNEKYSPNGRDYCNRFSKTLLVVYPTDLTV